MSKPQAKPTITSLSSQDVQSLLQQMEENQLSNANKGVIREAIERFSELLDKLKSSKINISQVQKLLGFYSEQLKKLRQD